MLKVAKSRFLVMLALALLVLYHSIAKLNFNIQAPLWVYKNFTLKNKSTTFFSMPSLAWSSANEKVPNLDLAAEKVADWGHFFKFKANDLPDWIFAGEQQPYSWFFLREEISFSRPIAKDRVEKGYAKQIAHVISAAENKGVIVIAVPVPTKLSLYREKASKDLPKETLWGPEKTKIPEAEIDPWLVYQKALSAQVSGNTVDLFSIFKKEKQQIPNEFLFVPGDSHWSSRAIAVTAREVIQKLNTKLNLKHPMATLVPHPNCHIVEAPDFYKALLVPISLSKNLQWREPCYSVSHVGRNGMPVQARLVVAGSSFSTRLQAKQASLGQVLAKALDLPLHDFAVLGGSGNGSFLKMNEEKFQFRRGDILVWEMPIRTPFKESEMPSALF